MTIDFYGLIAMSENPDTEYIIPANASIVNGDPIALAINPPHIDAARAFIQFTYSQEGQAVWLNQGINRLPIREDAFQTTLGLARTDIYTLFNNTMINQGIEFSEDLAASLEGPMRYHFQATITNVHTRHRTTWVTLVNAYKTGNITEAKFDELRADFVVPAMTMKEAQNINDEFNANYTLRKEKEDEWFEFASTKYDLILDLLSGKPNNDNLTTTTTTTTNEVTSSIDILTTNTSMSDTTDIVSNPTLELPIFLTPILISLVFLKCVKKTKFPKRTYFP
jgi:hypothetical protein